MEILLAEASRKYIVSRVSGAGLHEFKKICLGLVNSSKTFVRLIDSLFGQKYFPNFFASTDDLISISKDFKNLLKLLEKILQIILKFRLIIKTVK